MESIHGDERHGRPARRTIQGGQADSSSITTTTLTQTVVEYTLVANKYVQQSSMWQNEKRNTADDKEEVCRLTESLSFSQVCLSRRLAGRAKRGNWACLSVSSLLACRNYL